MTIIWESELGVAEVIFEERSPATIERSSFEFLAANANNTSTIGGLAIGRQICEDTVVE